MDLAASSRSELGPSRAVANPRICSYSMWMYTYKHLPWAPPICHHPLLRSSVSLSHLSYPLPLFTIHRNLMARCLGLY